MKRSILLTVGLIFVATLFIGCEPHKQRFGTLPAGQVRYTHHKPSGSGYYWDFDPSAASIELEPKTDVNPVQSQHVLIATVRDERGRPLHSRTVVWMIEGVGSIVEVDESGIRRQRGYVMDNKRAVSHTNRSSHTFTRGNDNPADDFTTTEGQTWLVITSPVEGTTHITAYAPGIFNWDDHKAFAVKHWMDVAWDFPPDAENPVGVDHTFVTRVTRPSDGSPIQGAQVNYRIRSGPAGSFNAAEGRTVTGPDGTAPIVLRQAQPQEGVNEVEIQIVQPGRDGGEPRVLATHVARKTWVRPAALTMEMQAPAQILICDPLPYRILVTNRGGMPARNVRILNELPEGLVAIVDGREVRAVQATIDTLAPGQSREVPFQARALRLGTINNRAVALGEGSVVMAEAQAQTLVNKPVLEVAMNAPQNRFIGRPLPYQVRIANTGDVPATEVRAVVTLPPGVRFQSAAQNGTHSGNNVTWNIGRLEPGQVVTLDMLASPTREGEHPASVSVTAYCADGAAQTVTVAEGIPALLLELIDIEDPIEVGATTTYRVTITNQGSKIATGTGLRAAIPESQQFVSAEGPAPHAVDGRTVTFAPLPNLPIGGRAVYNIVVRGIAPADSRFAVRMTSEVLNTPVDAEESTRIYE